MLRLLFLICVCSMLQLVVCHPALVPRRFAPFPVGTVKPAGWLKRQLLLEANGLAGHLQKFWVDVQNSSWVGGSGDGLTELHERFPYWLNGIVPLLFMIPDSPSVSAIRAEVDEMVSHVLRQQDPLGVLGPDTLSILWGD